MKKRAICTIILCIIFINALFVLSLISKLSIPIEEEYNITSEYKDFYPYALRGVIIENCDTITPGIYLKATGFPIVICNNHSRNNINISCSDNTQLYG